MRVILLILFLTSCTATRQPASREVIRLDGSKSFALGGIASYHWRQIAGLPVHIENQKSAVTFGHFNGKGKYLFELTVKDHAGAEDKDTAIVIKL